MLAACSDDGNEPSGPSVPGVDEGGGLAPAGTDQGTDVGEVDEEVDDNITGD